ncbi:hypothetical protein D0869_13209, partial [Hortaea werneckii]
MPGLPTVLPWNQTLGETIPPDTPHAVSVSLPTWKSNVGYEEGEQWVVDKMQTGYPRFFIHKSIQRLAQAILTQHGNTETENAMLVASKSCGTRCRNFLIKQNPSVDQSVIRILEFVPHPDRTTSADMTRVRPRLTAVIYPKELWPTAKVFWQHTGEGISSRQAEFCHRAYDDGIMAEHSAVAHSSTPRLSKGPKRYQRNTSTDQTHGNGANGHTNSDAAAGETGVPDSAQFVEERFGRNLSIAFAAQAKLAIRKRIAGSLTKDMDLPQSLDEPHDSGNERGRDVPGFSVEDVYLYGMGMNAIFNAHRCLMLSRGEMPSVMYGFPYVDTLKVLEKFGPGATFYGFGTQEELDDLERRCEN